MNERMKIKTRIEKKQGLIKGIQSFFAIAMIACLLLGMLSMFFAGREKHGQMVAASDVKTSVKTYPAANYNLSKKQETTADNVKYDIVTVGNVSFQMAAEAYDSTFGNQNSLDTEIYVLNIDNTEKYPLYFLGDNTLSIVRLSCLGEQPFTEDEIKAYEEKACPILTLSKRKAMGYKGEADSTLMLEDRMSLE